MTILNEYELHQLAILSYVEFNETINNKKDALIAMKILPSQEDLSDKEYSDIISKILNDKLDKKYLAPIDSLCILQENTNTNIEINLPVGHESDSIFWEIGSVKNQLKVSDTKPVYDFEKNLMRREIEGVVYERRVFEISQADLAGLSFDFHEIKLKIPGHENEVKTKLAYAPEKCYQPIDFNQEKVRGTSVAVPSIRSNENLGIGNYSDLAQFSAIMAQNGLDIVGTLPIHAMPHRMPESASPYSPISRTFFNFGYLDVTAIDDFKENPQIQEIYDSQAFESSRRKNQDTWTVDYTTSYELLMPMLQECYKSFKQNASPERKQQFESYKQKKGTDLSNFALYQALTEHFYAKVPELTDWRDWPKEYQSLNTPQVRNFAYKNQDSVDFFSYLQWESTKQIQNVQATCKAGGMKIGLYNDLAVGTIPGGYESWAYKDVYVDGSLGIPPDMCSAEGQNWGIIGYNPSVLEEQGFKPFINMLEANMQGGMLRIDCPLCGYVAANLIPNGKTAKECFSIYMPTDKMLAITALMSEKTKTPIVFEDLGAIPQYFREKIQKMNGITYKVLPYERCSTRDFPKSSIVVSSTHDSETLGIGWTGESAYLLANHNCLPEKYINNYLKDSWSYRNHMAGLLKAEGCIDNINPDINSATPESYYKAVAKLIGNNEHCSAAYGIMPIGDILGLPHWRENLPGTAELHTSKSPEAKSVYKGESVLPNPNWRLKLPLYLNELAANPRVAEISSILSSNDKRTQSQAYQRPGRNEPARRDENRLVQLYTHFAKAEEIRVANGEKPRFTGEAAYEIWSARFSSKRKELLSRQAQKQADNFSYAQKQISQHKSNYR